MMLEVLISASRMTVTESIPLFNTLLLLLVPLLTLDHVVVQSDLDFHETRVNKVACQESMIMLIPSLRCN